MMKSLILYLINAYQRRGGGARLLVDCNFEPTCSEYAKQAVQQYGAVRGLRYAVNRLRRCNDPDKMLAEFDPVPEE